MDNVNKSREYRQQSIELQQSEEEIEASHKKLDSELSVNRSLMTEELYMSQLDLDHLPISMGDTLFLQVFFLYFLFDFPTQLSHVKKLACMRNNFTGLLSSDIPQMSAYHLRNLEVYSFEDFWIISSF
jgi:hypothetical protein